MNVAAGERSRVLVAMCALLLSAFVCIGVVVLGVGASSGKDTCESKGVPAEMQPMVPSVSPPPLTNTRVWRFPVVSTTCTWSTSDDTSDARTYVDAARTTVNVVASSVIWVCAVLLYVAKTGTPVATATHGRPRQGSGIP